MEQLNEWEVVVHGQHLLWGVHESYVSYVRSLPDGTVHCADGARALDNVGGCPAWAFEHAGPAPIDADPDELRFRGDLRFAGHGGMMFVMILDPWISFTATGVHMTVVDLDAWPDTSVRMTLAESPPGWQADGLAEIPLALHEAGCQVFGNIYPAGTPLSPVHISGGEPTAALPRVGVGRGSPPRGTYPGRIHPHT